jgi:hypothetical protein
MATAPLAPPSDIGNAPPEVLEKYNAALDAQVKALDNRGNINFFNLAKAFANPGRTGSFAESFGNAMGEIGKQRETDEAQAIPIAQMRASLVGQKYQMQKEQESNNALMGALGGGNASDVMQAISSPQGAFGNPQLYQALVRAQMLAQPGTSAAAKIEKLLNTQKEMLELGIKQGTLSTQQVESVYKYGAQAGNTSGSFVPPKTAPTSGSNPNLTSGPARPQPITGDTVPMGTPPARAPGEEADFHGTEETGKPTTNAPPARTSTTATAGGWTKLPDGRYQLPSGTIVPFPPGTPQGVIDDFMAKLAAEEKTTAEQSLRDMSKEEINAYSKKRADLISQNEGQLTTQIGDLTNTVKILSNPKFERVVGLLQAKDPDSDGTVMSGIFNGVRSLAAGAQEGLKIGNYGAISAPIEEMMRVQKFTKEERAAFNEVRNTIASGLIATIQGAGKALGVNPTDADRTLYELASASTSNLAANTIYWAQKRIAQTQFEYAAVTGVKDYVGRHPAEYFTRPTSPYSKAQKEYRDKMARIQSRAPGTEKE